MANMLPSPRDYVGAYKADTHISTHMVVKVVGQTGNEVTIAGADGATACTCLGVAAMSATYGKSIRVATEGIVTVLCSAAVAAGQRVMVDTVAGTVAPSTDRTAPGVGVALTAGAAGGTCQVQLDINTR